MYGDSFLLFSSLILFLSLSFFLLSFASHGTHTQSFSSYDTYALLSPSIFRSHFPTFYLSLCLLDLTPPHLTQPKRATVTHFHPFNSSSLLIVIILTSLTIGTWTLYSRSWRVHFSRTVAMKFNCFFLMPFLDDFPTYLVLTATLLLYRSDDFVHFYI